MIESRIPVDLFNPGQVFACLGFMELADVLLGDAEAGFDWSDPKRAQFKLSVAGDKNPIEAVLDFLTIAAVTPMRPAHVDGPWPQEAIESETFPAPLSELLRSDRKGYTASALPILLESEGKTLIISNWLEGDGRKSLKLFAGQQVASKLMKNALDGDPSRPGTVGISQLSPPPDDPFQCGPVGGRFGYDARGAWDAIQIGSSLDEQGATLLVSPAVEALSAIGLEYTRPFFLSTYEILYAAWRCTLPPSLARVAFTHADNLMSRNDFRFFRAYLGDDKQYKKCFPANEE